MKYLYIDTNPDGITGEIHSPDFEMHTLYGALWEIYENWIDIFKKHIKQIIDEKKEDNELLVETVMIRVLNNEDLLLYDFFEENNPEKTYFYIKQEVLWQAIREYNNIDRTKKYKRITISYDGNKVYFDLEPFPNSHE